MSEENLNDFLNYLKKIGLIEDYTFQFLYNIYLNLTKHSMNNNFTNSMCATLLYFFNNMTEEQQKYSSFNLITNYFKNKKEKSINKLNNIIEKIIIKKKKELFHKLNRFNNENKGKKIENLKKQLNN